MSELLWKSEDGYVVVVDQLHFPEEDDETPREIDQLFDPAQGAAWIVVWRAEGTDYWRVTRSRRYAKPALAEIRQRLRAMENTALDGWNIASNGAAAHERYESRGSDPIEVGQAIYAAWQAIAADALPAKLAFLGVRGVDFPNAAAPAWMRPGLELYRSQKRLFLEIVAEAFE